MAAVLENLERRAAIAAAAFLNACQVPIATTASDAGWMTARLPLAAPAAARL